MSRTKYVYLFEEGQADMKSLLGGKGANLAEMTRIGLPVPPGFTITTEACKEYYRLGKEFPPNMMEDALQALQALEEKTGKRFGDRDNPLLVSVRSGAPVSMPGMMDTILNLGLNDVTVEGLASLTGDERFALDCYRRFIQMFSNVVLNIDHAVFDAVMEKYKKRHGLIFDYEIPADGLRSIITEYKGLVLKEAGREFPQDVYEQLQMAIKAVFESWNNQRAIVYRKLNKIPDDLGTAVNVQAMAFGNMGSDSGTGVAFTRNPSTGERELYGEFLVNAQGEDVVAGIRTPTPISKLKDELPQVYEQFTQVCQTLESHYRDMQDIEFTVEKGKLYMLQTRSGKRTAAAAIKIAVDMVKEGLITREEAILRVDPNQINQLLHRQIDSKAQLNVIARGLPASPGAASGKVVFDADEAERLGNEGEKVILVRSETTPDDIHGIVKAQGVLTSRGGMTSHAAVVARGMGKPCVCGCEAIKIDPAGQEFSVGDIVVKKGETISIDGATGNVMLGEVPMIEPTLSEEFETLLKWADDIRKLGVRANADTPEDAAKAREFGAEGIGLCRTEHMFMAQDRLPIVQEMILADTEEARRKALAKLLPMQREDFYGILKAMAGFPVTIRLLDPPLHEFLPGAEELLTEIAEMNARGQNNAVLAEKRSLLKKVYALREFNPMLGHRGCRLGITYPEIYRMQARAIFEAVVKLKKEGIEVLPEVEIPLVMDSSELAMLKREVLEVYEEVKAETGVEFEFAVGTMIELPRACVVADEIAAEADFFSFGTNDLTQTTLGFSRDDAEGKFIPIYLEKKLLKDNPFAVLDRKGVGSLMIMAIEKGRSVNSGLLIGICGEHGGEPSSVEFCHQIGLHYVSCSPYRVPVARLAAAQAAVLYPRE
ncbi:MAG TPA: pyruvate, phosphate dikinase [Syntrophothermus lipocalidus]|uniref:Pyruvate, phosphate dikinase n=1 Tax=Syntrophothermus lipocalidus (strain DSM 12680 / TGB-C1) TaxID=643648 RepID=D7CNU9_SYNLT|nr:pyruvate, phosphate dikinase [Syntrophothermus lipocalidus]ADI02384.1 pyruvate, phosphate dikinase [Syntrophothermus lipocalidus DSM 12680]HHV77794.1 pyruvate, phosphate dikinase [Syntrophothermus lipocalidus]